MLNRMPRWPVSMGADAVLSGLMNDADHPPFDEGHGRGAAE